MNGGMDIVVNRIPNAISIPSKALFTRDGKPDRLSANKGRYTAVEVEVLARNPDEVAITGIPAGAMVDPGRSSKRRTRRNEDPAARPRGLILGVVAALGWGALRFVQASPAPTAGSRRCPPRASRRAASPSPSPRAANCRAATPRCSPPPWSAAATWRSPRSGSPANWSRPATSSCSSTPPSRSSTSGKREADLAEAEQQVIARRSRQPGHRRRDPPTPCSPPRPTCNRPSSTCARTRSCRPSSARQNELALEAAQGPPAPGAAGPQEQEDHLRRRHRHPESQSEQGQGDGRPRPEEHRQHDPQGQDRRLRQRPAEHQHEHDVLGHAAAALPGRRFGARPAWPSRRFPI